MLRRSLMLLRFRSAQRHGTVHPGCLSSRFCERVIGVGLPTAIDLCLTLLRRCSSRLVQAQDVPIYHLKCVLRFRNGHAGAAFDDVALGADRPDEAIALAKLYRCSTPGMTLSVAVLLDETGAPIWSHRALSPEDLDE